jgi:peptidoglycan/xylan/chitin deacetylase (PgdA/CDA1 family)
MKAVSIMYHDVVASGQEDASGFPGPDAALYKLEREQFAKHLHAIAAAVPARPASVLSLSSLTKEKAPLLITFDDGGRSAYTSVAGMLEEKGWRGHFLVTTDYLDTPTFLSRDETRELHRRGHIIGSHSASHPTRMSYCSWDQLVREWKTSTETLAEILGEPVTVASVPGGHYSKRVAEAAALAGIRALFTSEPVMTCDVVNGCLVLGRYTVQRWLSPESAAQLACGHLTPRLRQLLFWNAKKLTKTLGGEYYLKLRRSLLGQS